MTWHGLRSGTGADFLAQVFLFALVMGCGLVVAADYPPPPLPPPPPTGLAETYYSTCGGSHPPLQYVVTHLKDGDPGYKEVERYARSPEYRRYLSDIVDYKRRYESDKGTYGEVDIKSGQERVTSRARTTREAEQQTRRQRMADRRKRESERAQRGRFKQEGPLDTNGPDFSELQKKAQADMDQRSASKEPASQPSGGGRKIASGPQRLFGFTTGGKKSIAYGGNVFNGKIQGNYGGRVHRNPRQDLARWLRGFLYHDAVNGVDYSDAPERATHLDSHAPGAGMQSGFYSLLVKELKLSVRTKSPTPKQVMAAIGTLWNSHWRSNLGFKYDPDSSKLLAQLSSTVDVLDKAQRQLDDLKKRSTTDRAAAIRLKQQIYTLNQEVTGARKKELQLRDDWVRRTQFVRAMVALLRFAPDGGFGPSAGLVQSGKVQASARKVLLDIGTLAGGPVWSGLIQDQNWLLAHQESKKEVDAKNKRPGKKKINPDIERRKLALKVGWSLLAEPRLAGYSAVCEYLIENRSVPKEAYQKGFELIERRATLGVDAHLLQAVPHLANYARDINPLLAKSARSALLKILSAPESKLDSALVKKSIAPLLCDQNAEIASAAQAFMAKQAGVAGKK